MPPRSRSELATSSNLLRISSFPPISTRYVELGYLDLDSPYGSGDVHARVPDGPEYRWPNHFPPGCPPADAVSCSGVVFRLVAGEPLGPSDFLSWWDEGKADGLEGDKLSQSCGLSVTREVAELQRMRRKVPGFRGKLVASGELMPRVGKMKPTPSGGLRSHCTWWVPLGIRPWSDVTFKMVP